MFDLFGILVAVGVISLVFWLEINLIFYMADRRYITRGTHVVAFLCALRL